MATIAELNARIADLEAEKAELAERLERMQAWLLNGLHDVVAPTAAPAGARVLAFRRGA